MSTNPDNQQIVYRTAKAPGKTASSTRSSGSRSSHSSNPVAISIKNRYHKDHADVKAGRNKPTLSLNPSVFRTQGTIGGPRSDSPDPLAGPGSPSPSPSPKQSSIPTAGRPTSVATTSSTSVAKYSKHIANAARNRSTRSHHPKLLPDDPNFSWHPSAGRTTPVETTPASASQTTKLVTDTERRCAQPKRTISLSDDKSEPVSVPKEQRTAHGESFADRRTTRAAASSVTASPQPANPFGITQGLDRRTRSSLSCTPQSSPRSRFGSRTGSRREAQHPQSGIEADPEVEPEVGNSALKSASASKSKAPSDPRRSLRGITAAKQDAPPTVSDADLGGPAGSISNKDETVPPDKELDAPQKPGRLHQATRTRDSGEQSCGVLIDPALGQASIDPSLALFDPDEGGQVSDSDEEFDVEQERWKGAKENETGESDSILASPAAKGQNKVSLDADSLEPATSPNAFAKENTGEPEEVVPLAALQESAAAVEQPKDAVEPEAEPEPSRPSNKRETRASRVASGAFEAAPSSRRSSRNSGVLSLVDHAQATDPDPAVSRAHTPAPQNDIEQRPVRETRSVFSFTSAAALASKSRKGPLGKDKAGKKMIITCYADDAKEPDLIGECVVPIDEVLKKGEVDEWYEFLYKEKYAGEVYLELTFYSNDAPPVKRNPSIQKYGQSSVLTPAASAASLSSRPSMQSLATSSSVAGMNLYIPPYIQPAQALQAPPATHNQGHMQGSSSFANLGVPQHQGGPHGHVQSYGHMPSAASTSTLHVHDPMDALTRPMSSMSISSAATGQPSRPLPPTAPQHSVPPAHPSGAHMPQPGQHRHSLGEAPWANLLPQNQPVMPSYTPVSRPVSAAESYGQSAWDHARFAASTPLARPASQAYNPSHNVPIANGGAYPPQQPAVPHHRHAHSFSGLSAAEPHPSTYLKPAMPQPPIPPASAPPAPYVPPIPEQDWQHNHSQNYQQGQTSYTSSSSHYPLPSSSFPTLNASHSQTPDPYRATTPTPSTYGPTDPYDPRAATPLPAVPYNQYDQMQNQGQYGTSDPYRATTPTPGNYQQQQPQPPYHPPPQSANPLNTSTSSSHYYPADPTPPRRQSTPSMSQQNQGYQPTPPSQPNAQGYVPWFQQTRPGSTATPPPPPVPDYTRPVPAPPAPPKGGAGYYPSDELYVQQQHQPPQQQPSPYGWQAPGQPPSLPSTGSALENAIGQRAPYGWQSTVGEPSRQPSPAPAAYGQTHDYQQHQQQGYQAPYADANTSSSSVSTGYHAAANGVTAAPGTSAMKQDWKSYMASLGSSGSFPARSPSPLPPVPPPPAQGQGDWYTPPPAVPSSIRPQDGWNGSGQCNQ